MATKTPFVVKHGLEVTGNVVITGVMTSESANLATQSYVDSEVATLSAAVNASIAGVVSSAPETLDTLNELSAALNDDANFATTVATNLGQKLGATASVALTGDVTGSASFSANAVSLATEIASGTVGISELNVTDGTDGQFLSTDGAGTLSFASVPAGYTDGDVDSHLSGGTGVTYSSGSISIGQAVATGDNVQFNSVGVGTAGSGTAGSIRATNSIVAYYSDARLKDFEGTIPHALDKVMQINGYIYTGNARAGELGYDMEERQVGVSAQEIEAVMPEVIEDAPINDMIESGEKDYKTVQYDRIVALLIEAIKEQQGQIEELKAKIEG